MDIHIRNAKKEDYQAVRKIMNQVQEMHVAWRPDIYKSNENLISEEIFDLMISSGNLYVADVDGTVAGVLEVTYAGFMNIKTEPVKDLIFGLLNRENTIFQIIIDGKTEFDKNDVYPSDAEIELLYHTFMN